MEKIEQLLAKCGIGINISFTEKDAIYKVLIKITYTYRLHNYADTHSYNIIFTDSSTNCGLLYLDGFNQFYSNAFEVYVNKDMYSRFRSLNEPDQQELNTLFVKYILYKSWLKLGSSKQLVFMRTGYKEPNGNFTVNIANRFISIVDSYYESPKNVNSGKTQLHGCVNIDKYRNLEVPEKFEKLFLNE